MAVSNTRRIVILGKTGVGKSSLANTIFGETVFAPDGTFNSGTKQCQAETRSVNGRSITLIDTPGFFDTDRSEEEMAPEMVRCITECAPGPHAFLIVLKVARFTEQERDVINKIQKYFSEEAFKYATVVFTHGDQLPDGTKIEDFVDQNEAMKDLVKKCGDRCHVVDNKYWRDNQQDEYRSNQIQVEELLKTIDKFMTDNNGRCYTNEMLQEVEKIKKQEEENIRKQSRNMTEEEISKRAKDNVTTKLLVRLAGIATGALLGAFLGVIVVGGVVMVALKNIPAIKAPVEEGLKLLKSLTLAPGSAPALAPGSAPRSAPGSAPGSASESAPGSAPGSASESAPGSAPGSASESAPGSAPGASPGKAAAVAGTTITVMLPAAAAGAVMGVVAGYVAAEGADTPQEAAKRAAAAVRAGASSALDAADDLIGKISSSK